MPFPSDAYCVYEITGEEKEEAFLTRLSEERRKYCLAAKSGRARSERLFSSLVLEALLSVAKVPVPYTYAFSERGKPGLAGCDVFISISHSFPYVAAAVSTAPVGIDIETADPGRRKSWRKIAGSRFVPEDLRQVFLSENNFTAFLGYFTSAEACSKAFDRPLAGVLTDPSWREDRDISVVTEREKGYVLSAVSAKADGRLERLFMDEGCELKLAPDALQVPERVL